MINKIKKDLSNLIGKKVFINVNSIRNKNEYYEGVLIELYDRIFVLRDSNNDLRSFSYVDLLIGNIQLDCKKYWQFINKNIKFK